MLTEAEVCALTNKEYNLGVQLKLHPDKNFGCTNEAEAKYETLKQYRSRCPAKPKSPKHPSPAKPKSPKHPSPEKSATPEILAITQEPHNIPKKTSPTKKISPYRLAKGADQFNAFRTRNHVSWDRDVYGNIITKGLYEPTKANIGSVWESTKGLLNTGLGALKVGRDTLKGAYHVTEGIALGLHGIARAGQRTLRRGQKSWARMRYNRAKRHLRDCTTDCNSIDDCCTKDQIQTIKDDMEQRYAALKAEEIEKRERLFEEARQYAQTLPADEAEVFKELATDQILADYLKAVNELDEKQGGRSRRSRRSRRRR